MISLARSSPVWGGQEPSNNSQPLILSSPTCVKHSWQCNNTATRHGGPVYGEYSSHAGDQKWKILIALPQGKVDVRIYTRRWILEICCMSAGFIQLVQDRGRERVNCRVP
jgi:hypothetical protein